MQKWSGGKQIETDSLVTTSPEHATFRFQISIHVARPCYQEYICCRLNLYLFFPKDKDLCCSTRLCSGVASADRMPTATADTPGAHDLPNLVSDSLIK
jgi:hypothetical protein